MTTTTDLAARIRELRRQAADLRQAAERADRNVERDRDRAAAARLDAQAAELEKSEAARKKELAKIHLAKSQLRMADDAYRAMLWSVARARSAADLDARGRRLVLEHLKGLGFRGKRPGRPRPAPDRELLVRKIRAQLKSLDLPDKYADGMAKRMHGVERFEWCDPAQLQAIVAALTYHQKRKGAPTA